MQGQKGGERDQSRKMGRVRERKIDRSRKNLGRERETDRCYRERNGLKKKKR